MELNANLPRSLFVEWAAETFGLPTNGRRSGTESCTTCCSFSTSAPAAGRRIASQHVPFLDSGLFVVGNVVESSLAPVKPALRSCYKKCSARVHASRDSLFRLSFYLSTIRPVFVCTRTSSHFLCHAAVLQQRASSAFY